MTRRVVVTGLGVISPIGSQKENFWNALISGKSGIKEATAFNTSNFNVHNVAEVKDFNPQEFIPADFIKKYGRAAQYAMAASNFALKDSLINLEDVDPLRVGVALGTTMGETQVFESLVEKYIKNELDISSKDLISQYPSFRLSSSVAEFLNLRGPNSIFPTACSAGNYAISFGFDCIKDNKADIMFCGGVDVISIIAFTGFARMLSISPDICRPFDKDRKGIIVGEGCGMLLLEELESAKKKKSTYIRRGFRLWSKL